MEDYRVRKHTDAFGKVHIETESVEPNPENMTPEERDIRTRIRIARALESIASSPLLQHPLLTIAGSILAAGLISAIFSFILAAIFVR